MNSPTGNDCAKRLSMFSESMQDTETRNAVIKEAAELCATRKDVRDALIQLLLHSQDSDIRRAAAAALQNANAHETVIKAFVQSLIREDNREQWPLPGPKNGLVIKAVREAFPDPTQVPFAVEQLFKCFELALMDQSSTIEAAAKLLRPVSADPLVKRTLLEALFHTTSFAHPTILRTLPSVDTDEEVRMVLIRLLDTRGTTIYCDGNAVESKLHEGLRHTEVQECFRRAGFTRLGPIPEPASEIP